MKPILLCSLLLGVAHGAQPTSLLLGQQLSDEKSYELSAVEFRRYALEETDAEASANAKLHAAYAYLEAGELDDAKCMLDQSEMALPASDSLTVVSAELAAQQKDDVMALYFLDMVESDSELGTYAARRAAELQLRQGRPQLARQRLAEDSAALAAIDQYVTAPQKSPTAGGLWGLIPGGGYFYSGEIANGFRSLILNGVFMFGMAASAQDEQWGAFAAISFFEITWYSGSIYGGIDAAHRHNKRALEACIDDLQIPTIEPSRDVVLPVFQLKVAF